MRKIVLNILVALMSFSFLSFANSEEEKMSKDKKSNETELNFFTGMFDFSDTKQASGLFGLQHQNDELFRKSFLGKLSPVTGGFLTENNAFYLYTGVQAEYEIGFLKTEPIIRIQRFAFTQKRTLFEGAGFAVAKLRLKMQNFR